jgi:hypothetical protein
MIRKFTKACFLAATMFTGLAANAACPPGGNCNCGPNYDLIECGFWNWDCQSLACVCKSLTGAPTVTDGPTGTPTVVGSGDANACNVPQGNGPNQIAYTNTSGWSIEICLGAEVQCGTGALPGANWTFSAQGCWTYNSESSVAATADISAPACTWWRKEVIDTPTRKDVSVPLEYITTVTITNDSSPASCCNTFGKPPGASWSWDVTCSSTTRTSSDWVHHYSFPMTNLTANCTTRCCPAP